MKRHVIITGATGGLGSCIAKECILSDDISHLSLLCRNHEKYVSIYGKLIKTENKVIQEELIGKSFSDSNGGLFISKIFSNKEIEEVVLVITAFTIIPLKKIGKYSESEVLENLTANIANVVLMINQLIKSNKNNIRIKIINIDSGAAYNPIGGWAMYCAAKAYINMFLKTLAVENSTIQVVTYEPGVIDTNMQEIIRKSNSEIIKLLHTK